ncbi:MAG: DUF1844 domain-containing protein [Proteobacteria bacterium]|nr:DUF1844 domain-containing protein [Pseudomonadota bacterium]
MEIKTERSSLSELVLGLTTIALEYLGEISYQSNDSVSHSEEVEQDKQPLTTRSQSTNSESSSTVINFDLAKKNIEWIEAISEKTAGNLTTTEQGLIDTVLIDLKQKLSQKQQDQS